jgi:hypothetical protein
MKYTQEIVYDQELSAATPILSCYETFEFTNGELLQAPKILAVEKTKSEMLVVPAGFVEIWNMDKEMKLIRTFDGGR